MEHREVDNFEADNLELYIYHSKYPITQKIGMSLEHLY